MGRSKDAGVYSLQPLSLSLALSPRTKTTSCAGGIEASLPHFLLPHVWSLIPPISSSAINLMTHEIVEGKQHLQGNKSYIEWLFAKYYHHLLVFKLYFYFSRNGNFSKSNIKKYLWDSNNIPELGIKQKAERDLSWLQQQSYIFSLVVSLVLFYLTPRY